MDCTVIIDQVNAAGVSRSCATRPGWTDGRWAAELGRRGRVILADGAAVNHPTGRAWVEYAERFARGDATSPPSTAKPAAIQRKKPSGPARRGNKPRTASGGGTLFG